MNKKNMDCPFCKYNFVSFTFNGLKNIICPYCDSRIKV